MKRKQEYIKIKRAPEGARQFSGARMPMTLLILFHSQAASCILTSVILSNAVPVQLILLYQSGYCR